MAAVQFCLNKSVMMLCNCLTFSGFATTLPNSWVYLRHNSDCCLNENYWGKRLQRMEKGERMERETRTTEIPVV